MAMSLADRGVDVIVTYRGNADGAQEVVEHIRKAGRKAAALQLDVGDAAAFDGFEDRLRSTLSEMDIEALTISALELERGATLKPATYRKRLQRALSRLRSAWRTRHGVE